MSILGPKTKGAIQVGKDTGGVPGFVHLPIGPDGQVLTADSAVDEGIKWAAQAGLNVSIFTFTHIVGTVSTGALGFTPKFAIYSGRALDGGGETAMACGLVKGTGTDARSAGVTASSGTTFASGSSVISLPGVNFISITAFGAGGIDLTWTGGAASHTGYLLVVG